MLYITLLHRHQLLVFLICFCAIDILWFRVFHVAKPFQFSNINFPTPSIFVPRGYPYIYDIYIRPYFFLTILHSLYIRDLKFSLFLSFLSRLFLPRYNLNPSYCIDNLLPICLLMTPPVYLYVQNHV